MACSSLDSSALCGSSYSQGKSSAVTFKSSSLTAQPSFFYLSTESQLRIPPFSTSSFHPPSPLSLVYLDSQSNYSYQVLAEMWYNRNAYIFQGSIIATTNLGNSLALSTEVKHMCTRWPSNFTFHYIQHVYQEISTRMFIAALIVIALNWIWPSVHQQ